MAQTYKFQVSMPVTDTLPRNRMTNVVHLEHVSGGLLDTDLEDMCADIVQMYSTHYGDASREVQCKAYDTDAVPNYPRADVVINSGNPWGINYPREIALCLSFAGDQKGNRRQRGRIYLCPFIVSTATGQPTLRPTAAHLDWALKFYTEANNSFPDLGGVDWKFGVWSSVAKDFTQATQAWVNDDWDVQRKRGLRESTRVQAIREG
jgi:hypothetical protein